MRRPDWSPCTLDCRGSARYRTAMWRWWWGGVALIVCTLAVPSARAQYCNLTGVPDAAELCPAAFESSSVSLGLPAPGRLLVTDLDDDRLPDVAVVHTLSNQVATWTNTGGAAFTAGP